MSRPSAPSRSLGLVIDLSQSGFAAALDADGEGVLARSARPIEARGTRDNLADWLDGLLAEAGGDLKNLSWICAGLGPGSFTGIRMALAFVQGVALPRRVPLYGFTAFEALFLTFPEASEGDGAVAAIPANAGRFYLSKGLRDEGLLGDAAALAALAAERPTLLIPAAGPASAGLTALAALETAAKDFKTVLAAEGEWDAARIARHARASGRGLERPHYLQASAAEDAQAALQTKRAEEKA